MTAVLTFHPLGNADCTRIDFTNGKKMLMDYANMCNLDDPYDKRVDLPEELKSDLRAAQRNHFDVVCFTHLDDDRYCGSGDFFDLAAKYQGEARKPELNTAQESAGVNDKCASIPAPQRLPRPQSQIRI